MSDAGGCASSTSSSSNGPIASTSCAGTLGEQARHTGELGDRGPAGAAPREVLLVLRRSAAERAPRT